MKKLLLIAILLFTCILSLTLSVFSQVTQEWVQRYNGPIQSGDDEAFALAVDSYGNVYVTGYSEGSGTSYDYLTIKYNYYGGQLWAQRYDGPGNNNDIAYAIAVDDSGNVYVTGESWGTGTGYDYATIKYNSSGVQQWVQRYNGPGNSEDIARSIKVDVNGNVYVTGKSNDLNFNSDYATIKYNSSGIQQWIQRYNGPGNSGDDANSLALDNSGNVYVTGYSSGTGTNYDYATIKYNINGIQQWVQRYDGPGNYEDRANSIAVDVSSNVYVTGYGSGTGTGNDYATIKYNSSGVQQWVQRYNGPGNNEDRAYSIAIDSDGNVYVTGTSTGINFDYDYATIKYNSNGLQQWVSRYNGPEDFGNFAYSIALDDSANVYVTGGSVQSGTGVYYDYATVKYNIAGAQQWVLRYNGPGNHNDIAQSVAVDGLRNVYVTGYSLGGSTYYDYATIKYSQLVGIQPISGKIPDKFYLIQNYPNPFNPSTTIEFDIKSKSHIKLVVYNVLGEEIEKLANEELRAGTYKVTWDASKFASGIYYCTLMTKDYRETKKMLLIK